MKVLIACEYSGTVRDAFRALGHDAISCDILPSEQPGPHYQGDVRELLGDGFDLMIAHPPCTYLSYAGTAHWNAPGRAELREEALAFALELYHCPIPLVAMENPKGHLGQAFRPADQYINPFQFGEPVRKRTGLWLKGLPLLVPTKRLPPPPLYTSKRLERPGTTSTASPAAKTSGRSAAASFPALRRQWRRSGAMWSDCAA